MIAGSRIGPGGRVRGIMRSSLLAASERTEAIPNRPRRRNRSGGGTGRNRTGRGASTDPSSASLLHGPLSVGEKNCHSSPSGPPAVSPPKNVGCWSSTSLNIPPNANGTKVGVGVGISVHWPPRKAQLSPKKALPSVPPTRSTTSGWPVAAVLRYGQSTIEAPYRAGGAVGGASSVQTPPANVHVSLSAPPALRPPKRTT